MSKGLVFFLALSCLVSLGWAGNCNNPLGEAQMVDLLDDPSSASGTCVDDVLAGESCCSQDYHDNSTIALEDLYDKYASNADYYVARTNAMDDIIDTVYDRLTDKLADLGSDVGDLSSRGDDDPDPELYYITSGEWRELVAAFPGYMAQCHQEIFNVAAAFNCLACDPDWNDYMNDYSGTFQIYLQDDNCDTMNTACLDADEVIYYWDSKLEVVVYYIFIVEWFSGNYIDFDDEDLYVDYADDYDPEDDFEEAALGYYSYLDGCYLSAGYDYYFLSYQIGLFGPSVRYLMLEINNSYLLMEELLAYGNGGSNIFEDGVRRRALEQPKKEGRMLANEEYFVISFTSSNSAVDALDIADTLGTAPTVAELSAQTLLLSFCALLGLFLTILN